MSDPEEQCLKVKSLKAARMVMSYSNIGEAVMAWTEGNGVKVITRTVYPALSGLVRLNQIAPAIVTRTFRPLVLRSLQAK
jgi:hypothetical protein